MASFDEKIEGLRRRNVKIVGLTDEEARKAVLQLNADEDKQGTQIDGLAKKTYGRTADGVVFTVPTTKDMVSDLLSPTAPKNVGDALLILVLAAHIFIFWLLPIATRIPVMMAIYMFWRSSYNIGIGWLLYSQSNQQTLIRWAQKSKLFGNPEDCDRPKLRAFVKSELEVKIPKDYSFDTAPLEYNTWLVFRRIVDVILMCDFTSYILLAIACGSQPEAENLFVTCGRWMLGLVLFFINLWVKLDAHRVVGDFAWYWGDFFYLIDQELIFDGVFEMAPHPMYSIGYVGYYGISAMAASYALLFVSIFAHAAQFAFLTWVENPHIARTYNSPPPRRRQTNETPDATNGRPVPARIGTDKNWPNSSLRKPPATHKLLGIQNLDLYRTTDSAVIVLMILMLVLTILTPNTSSYQAFFVAMAIICRLWYSVGIGYLLNRQSIKKKWTRHFVKYGESTGEAWRQWKGTYHLSMVMCYSSFLVAAWKMYAVPTVWDEGYTLLKHIFGMGLVALQIWVTVSVYDSLGEFGWFYGDFFFDHSSKLTYSGIYRFLNNPERILGLTGVWGIGLITESTAILAIAALSQVLSWALVELVERPHMQKLYGRNIREDAGLVRSLRRSLPPPLRQWQEEIDKSVTEMFGAVEERLDAIMAKLASVVTHAANDVANSDLKMPSRGSFSRLEVDADDLNPGDYAVEVLGDPSQILAAQDASIGGTSKQYNDCEGDDIQERDILSLVYGAPIKIKWTAPLGHSKRDWIGLYMITDNVSRDFTRVPSRNRWTATNTGEYDTLWAEVGLLNSDVRCMRQRNNGIKTEFVTGEMLFSGDKIWWKQGFFEFRYHHDGKHTVMATSVPFEVRIPRFDEADLEFGSTVVSQSLVDAEMRRAIERILLPLVQNCFDRDPDIAPNTPKEAFGDLVERDGKFSRRVVYAILHMFGIEFAGEVVKADGKVENLAWRIWEAKKVLAPYSLSNSRGTSTPVERDVIRSKELIDFPMTSQ